MKKLMILVLALMLAIVPAVAETTITVSGQGDVYVSANEATIQLGISAQSAEVRDAQQQVNSVIIAIRQALIEAGVAKEDINTDTISIYPIYGNSFDNSEECIVNYSASSSLAIRTEDMENIGSMIDLAFNAGANTLSDISFGAGDTSEADDAALRAAVADARSKAQIIAEAAGLQITGIRTINENYAYSYGSGVANFSRTMKTEAAADSATVVQASKLCVTANITIVFTAE